MINPVARRLMSLPDVGTVVAISFIVLADDPVGVPGKSDVGAFQRHNRAKTIMRRNTGDLGEP